MLLVPPEEQFGLRTQFSCPLDIFVFINDDDHDVEAISIASSCLGLNLGLFPIIGLESHLYIFEKCRASPFCSVLKFTDTFVVWGTFPQHVQSVNLGNFIQLLPASDSNRTALYATFTKDSNVMHATLLNVKLLLFEIDFNCTATIDDQQLHFEKIVKLFNRYPAKLTGKIKQTNDWNNAIIDIYGYFLTITNNIPELLCKEMKMYIGLSYNHSSKRVKIAETKYSTAIQQFSAAQRTYQEREANKTESASLLQTTENKLLEIQSNIKSLEEKLEMAGDEFYNIKETIEMLTNRCSINQCADEELCVPQDAFMPHLQNVSTPILDSCTVACTRKTDTLDVVGFRDDTTWQYEPQQQCSMSPNCRIMECHIQTKCTDEYISTPRTSEMPTIDVMVVDENVTCNEPCPEGQVYTSVEIPHTENVGCKINDSAVACIIARTAENDKCLHERKTVYEQLSNLNHAQTVLLEALDEAKENEAATKLQVMLNKVKHKLNEHQFNVSKVALREKEIALNIANSTYQQIEQQNPLDLLEKITNVSICGASPMAYLKIKSVDFSTAITTESPAILETDVKIFIPSLNKHLLKKSYINFQNINASLWEVAVAITEEILDQKLASRRQYRNLYNTNSKDSVQVLFQKRCTDIKNTRTYVKELNASISSVATIAISSMLEFDKNVIEIEKTIDSITTSNNSAANRSKTADELKKLMKEYIMNNKYIANTLQLDLFQSWQAKMEYLHNQTKSAAGFSCLGFSDCLQEVVDTLDYLVIGSPLRNFKDAIAFASAQQDLLDLALLQNYSIISAIANAQKIYKIANDPILYNYWCANPPNITVQPPKRIAARENTTVELTCKAKVEEHTMYQWKRNSVQMPNQINSTLVLKEIKLSDSGNYTCVVTNQVSSVTSINAFVEVQRLPSFLLQPKDVDVYFSSMNGAIFKSNATGIPNPGYRWYFQPKGATNFTAMPGGNRNELVIVAALPENEGSYYCEAFNEQGNVMSRIANLTVLESTVVQAARTVHLNFTKLDTAINSTFSQGLGSGEGDSGSERNVNITLTSTTITALQREIVTTLHMLLSFDSTSMENITMVPLSATTIRVSFMLYSKNISYPENLLSEINQLAPKARMEWLAVWEKLQEVLAISEFFISDGVEKYKSDPSSLKFDMLQFVCPPGREVSAVNNLLCGMKYYTYC